MNSDLPSTLRRLRHQTGMSLKDVAGRMGVHLSTVSSWERGRSEPGVEALQRLAGLYRVEVGSLLSGAGARPASEGFRPLSPAAGEEMLRRLEELRLAVCLAHAIGKAGRAEALSSATGMTIERLAALAAARGRLRPAEAAALVRELGMPGAADLPPAAVETAPLPEGLDAAVRQWLDSVRAYLSGPASSQ